MTTTGAKNIFPNAVRVRHSLRFGLDLNGWRAAWDPCLPVASMSQSIVVTRLSVVDAIVSVPSSSSELLNAA